MKEEIEMEDKEPHFILSLSAPILDILTELRRENDQNEFLLNSRKKVVENSE